MVRRILLALGGTPFSNVAVKRAVELARTQKAEITAVPVLDKQPWRSGMSATMSAGAAARLTESRPWAAAQARLERVLDGFRHACEEAGLVHRVQDPAGQPFEQLISQWRYHELLVFGLRGLFDYNVVPEPERAIAELIRQGVRPILAVSHDYRPIRRVLIAYSGSIESAKAMKQFAQMNLWPDARVQLACFDKSDEEADELLRDASAYLKVRGITATTEAVDGSPVSRLLPYAESIDADLIVLGSGYRSVLASSLLGDIMRHVTRHSDVPLFLSH